MYLLSIRTNVFPLFFSFSVFNCLHQCTKWLMSEPEDDRSQNSFRQHYFLATYYRIFVWKKKRRNKLQASIKHWNWLFVAKSQTFCRFWVQHMQWTKHKAQTIAKWMAYWLNVCHINTAIHWTESAICVITMSTHIIYLALLKITCRGCETER